MYKRQVSLQITRGVKKNACGQKQEMAKKFISSSLKALMKKQILLQEILQHVYAEANINMVIVLFCTERMDSPVC